MTINRILQVRGARLGLNTRDPVEDLRPGEAVVSQNVEYRRGSIAKRKGFANVLLGDGDNVYKGGPPGSSLYVQGDQYWLDHRDTRQPSANASREHNYNSREGLIVLPEGGIGDLRLDPQDGNADWAIDLTLWSDDFNPRAENHNDALSYWMPHIVMAKGDGGTGCNWAIRIIPEQGYATLYGDMRFKIVLTLYEGADDDLLAGAPTAAATDFFFDDGGGNKSWFAPGKRHWVGWIFDESAETITSYYWQEGGSVASSSQSLTATNLFLNGTHDGNFYPIVIGRKSLLRTTGAIGGSTGEQGFNGVVGEFRFYLKAGTITMPTWDDTWYLDREIPDEELNDVAGTVSGDTDLYLYFSFGQQYVTETQFVPPRYFSNGTVDEHQAWLTGADAIWTDGSGALGEKCLEIVPCGTGGGEESMYADAIANEDVHGRFQNYGGGVRIPNGDRYVSRPKDGGGGAGGASADPIWPEEMSLHFTVMFPELEAAGGDNHIILNLSRVRQGAPAQDYEVGALLQVFLFYDTAWRIRVAMRDGLAALNTTTTATFPVLENTVYSVAVIISHVGDTVVKIFIDGVQEASTALGAINKPDMSQNTGTDSTTPNINDDDDRKYCYPMSIGYSQLTFESPPATWHTGVFFGAQDDLGAAVAGDRRWWAFFNDETEATPSSGCAIRGVETLRGRIGSMTIWHKLLTLAEVDTFKDRPPNEQEIAAYGDRCLSSWNMEEGKDNILWDRGHLQNHLRIHPYPQVRSMAGPIHRRTKSPILGFWEVRTRTPREGVQGRELYALAGGSVCKVVLDGSGDRYFIPISARLINQQNPLPYAFQYSDYLYLCDGESPPQRISRGKVSHAGLSPVFGEFIQGDNLGWLEHDRDGTFEVRQTGANTGTDTIATVFEIDDKYIYVITYFDPEAGVESAPSRQMVYTAEESDVVGHDAGVDGAAEIIVGLFPRSHDKAAIRTRIYRTTANGGVFRFVDEVARDALFYVDTKPDAKLGFQIPSGLWFPPPQGVRFAATLGSRVIWAGVQGANATIFPSISGRPEAVPPHYAVTVAEGRSDEITGLHTIHNRTLVFLQDSTFFAVDNGADAGPNNPTVVPVVVQPLWKNVGCVNHHTIVAIDGIGTVFASERGIMVTDSVNFRYLSEKIEDTWATLNKSTYRQWCAVHWRRSDQYRLYCRTAAGAGPNDTCIVWDYRNQTDQAGNPQPGTRFSVDTGYKGAFAQVIEDENTGENRLYVADDLGQLWEYDSPDNPIDNDGAARGSFTTTSGTLQTGAATSTTYVRLVSDASLPTDGDGLIGVSLRLGDEESRIIESDTEWVRLETAFSTTPTVGETWYLGTISARWQSGKYRMGSENQNNRFQYVQMDTVENTGSKVDVDVTLDDAPANEFREVDMGLSNPRVGSIMGRGRKIQIDVSDDLPDNPWEIREMEIALQPKRRAAWQA